jgi:hypothetical protein
LTIYQTKIPVRAGIFKLPENTNIHQPYFLYRH